MLSRHVFQESDSKFKSSSSSFMCHKTSTSSYMDTDTWDWTAMHIVHLQLPLVMYSKTHKNTKRRTTEQNIVKNMRDNQRNRHLKILPLKRVI